MPHAAGCNGVGEFRAPSDGARGKRVQQHAPQRATAHFRPAAGAIVGLVEQHLSGHVEHARGLAARVDEGAKLVEQAGGPERELPAVIVDVQHAALRPRHRRGFGLEHGDGDAVEVQHAGEGEAAEACTDYRDLGQHRTLDQSNWNVVP